MRANGIVVRAAAVGALGGLLFGFDTAVIAGTTGTLSRIFQLSPQKLGLTVAIALCGTVLGAIIAGPLESRYGGRKMLRLMALFYLFSALGCAFASDWNVLMVARFCSGIGIGGSSVIGPVYIAEIAPARLRGRLVGMFQINIVLGILLAYLSNYAIARAAFGPIEWRMEFGVAALPALLFFLLLFTIPQSARWTAAKGCIEDAREILKITGAADPEAELQSIVSALREDALHSTVSLFQWRYRKPIFLAISIAMFNQLSGINAITYYLNDIFVSAGFSSLSGNLQAVVFGLMNLFATLLAMTVIDKIGRRTLLLAGSIGMAISLAGVSFVFHSGNHVTLLLPLLITYIFFFATSQGAVIWVYLSEVFPTQVRGKGQSLGSGTHWVMNALISASFPIIAKSSRALPFLLFSIMMIIQFIVVRAYFPETKNVTLEELQKQLVT
jgi:sugar porter (SP) family MFS transporter